MASALNVKVGVCSVSVDGVDLGHTKGGVSVSYEPKFKEIMVDLYGETVVEKVLVGQRLIAKVPLAEYTIANLRKAMPQTEFAGAANARITIGHNAGQSGLTDAVQLVLHPISEGTRRFDTVIYKACASGTVELKFNNDDERVIEVTFEGLVDESKSDGNYLGLIGDSTA